MLGGFLEFFMHPSVVEIYQTMKREIDEIIQHKVSGLQILFLDYTTRKQTNFDVVSAAISSNGHNKPQLGRASFCSAIIAYRGPRVW